MNTPQTPLPGDYSQPFVIHHADEDQLVRLLIGEYQTNSQTAVLLVDADDEQIAAISFNSTERLPWGQFLAKTYSENDGLLDQLAERGIVAVLELRTTESGLIAPLCELTL